ncbi:MAG TPA: ferritin-like domain-containing protein, partial [Polyangiaceae bacterium]|nr:ferritin-like domain-containing protein [Polyangiaceae bacterium]
GADFLCGSEEPPAGALGCAGDECCYVLGGGCPIGRPFIVAGEARTARSVTREDWQSRLLPDVSHLDAATRRALADAYRKDGLSEHASVASFARFVLECLALGAPAELVSDAQAALRDEIEHARSSFGLASAYAGEALGPSALEIQDCLAPRLDRHECALRALREGCIAETVSAALLRRASDVATDPTVKAVLSRVAEDERRHAVLAWRFVRWLIGQEGKALAAAAAKEFERAPRYVGFGATTELPGNAEALRAHGYLPMHERRQIAMQTLRQVVMPCARALAELAGHPASTPPPRSAASDGGGEQLV